MPSHFRSSPCSLVLLLVLGSCSGGGDVSSNPVGGVNVPPELLACRARIDSPHSYAEIVLRTAQNLGTNRISDRSGPERHVRLHPDGNTVVFARERNYARPDSREVYVSTIDGSRSELRLTLNSDLDDEPCWSPDGGVVLFTSDRSGSGRLWKCNASGTNPGEFLTPPAGESDGEADWCRATNRIVFSRSDSAGKHSLWLVQGDGTGLVQLTDGGLASGADTGDRHPAFSPDGTRVAFSRRISADLAALYFVEVATGVATMRYQPVGEADVPRWAPAADRVFFGLAEPTLGRATLRLASLPVTSGNPVLLWPDNRWRLQSIEVMPALPAIGATNAPQVLDVNQAQIQIAAGNVQYASNSQLASADGDEFTVYTATSGSREIAGINCRYELPVANAEDMAEVRVRATARVARADAGSVLRMSIYNPVDERFDIVFEQPVTDTAAHTMTFTTTSLRHLTRERHLRVTVIGDLPAGARSQLLVDQFEVTLVTHTTAQ
jgi:hypothetical protein